MQAQKCLGVLQNSEAVQAELKAYQAILQLKDLGIEILPMQFLQVQSVLLLCYEMSCILFMQGKILHKQVFKHIFRQR